MTPYGLFTGFSASPPRIYFVKNEGFPAISLDVLILVRYCTLAVSGGAGKTRGPFSSNTEDGLFPAQEKKKNTQRKRVSLIYIIFRPALLFIMASQT